MNDEPRIPPLPPAERDERTAALLASMKVHPDGDDMNLFATLARHPKLLKRWSAFGGTLLFGGALPGEDRELLILRTAVNLNADYEWGHHLAIGRAEGLDDETMLRVLDGPDAQGWTDHQATLMRAADELHLESRITDDTWARLAERYDEKQLVEVPMLVGQYHLVGFTLNSLGIQREDGFEGFPNG